VNRAARGRSNGLVGPLFRAPGRDGRIARLAPPVARRSLRPQLNQIRAWVREGRTDAWIAHQLEVTVKDIDAFKREHELIPTEGGDDGDAAPAFGEERDMRAEDDALVAAELDAMDDAPASDEPAGEDGEEAGDGATKTRRRGRRGGRRRRGGGGRGRNTDLEGTFDHGEEGYGLWLDPAVADDPVYAEHWAGHRPVEVTIEEDQIVIRRAGGEDDDD
jgi:hypothetical protein